jgi:hypothetical protein
MAISAYINKTQEFYKISNKGRIGTNIDLTSFTNRGSNTSVQEGSGNAALSRTEVTPSSKVG